MARNIASVALGFVVMVLFLGITFYVAGTALGDERIYRPGSFEPSTLWIAISVPLTFAAAILGGISAASIARKVTALRVLLILIVALGLFAAIPSFTYDRATMPPRTGGPADRAAAMQIPPPLWIALLNPVLGASGIVIGVRLRGRSLVETVQE